LLVLPLIINITYIHRSQNIYFYVNTYLYYWKNKKNN